MFTLKRWFCAHEFGQWHAVTRVLKSMMYGRTEDEIQQRECRKCGFLQRAAIPEVKVQS